MTKREYEKKMKDYKKFMNTIRGIRISESKRLICDAQEKFSIGTMISEKYYPANIGLIASKPFIKRHTAQKKPYVYVSVLWMSNNLFGDGITAPMCVDNLKIMKQKKVLET